MIMGVLYWLEGYGRRKLAPIPAGRQIHHGRWVIKIGYNEYLRSRLVFFMHKGYWPEQVDHINRQTADDRIENLREATPRMNVLNRNAYSNTGIKHVYKLKSKRHKQGFYYYYGTQDKPYIKQSKSLNELLAFKRKYEDAISQS